LSIADQDIVLPKQQPLAAAQHVVGRGFLQGLLITHLLSIELHSSLPEQLTPGFDPGDKVSKGLPPGKALQPTLRLVGLRQP
jgi:hypothetical protein